MKARHIHTRAMLLACLLGAQALPAAAQNAAQSQQLAVHAAAPIAQDQSQAQWMSLRGSGGSHFLQLAAQSLERNHWSEAFEALKQGADLGDPQAARMAFDMWRFGPRLYQQEFEASVDQLQRWRALP